MTEQSGHGEGAEQFGPDPLPDDAQCSNCFYSEVIPVTDPKTGQRVLNARQRICRRMPPTTIPAQQPGGSIVFIGMFPVVADDAYCYEWDEKSEAEVIPTGLSLPGKI
jgi:hypothetical protein